MDGIRLKDWQGFLEKEGSGEDGLFCCYDVHKSPAVAHSCGVLARHLAAFLDDELESADYQTGSQQE